MTFFISLLQTEILNSFRNFSEVVINLFNLLGIQPSILIFPDVIFFLIIPFVISLFAMSKFFTKLRIFRRSSMVNSILAFLIVFIAVRFVFPFIFLLSMGYLIFVEKWPRSKWLRIGFVIGVILVYLYAFPGLANLTRQFLN